MEARFKRYTDIFADTAMNLNVDHLSLRMERLISRVIEMDSSGGFDMVTREQSGGIVESLGRAGAGRVVFTGEPDLAAMVVESARAAMDLQGQPVTMAPAGKVDFRHMPEEQADFAESGELIKKLQDYASFLRGTKACWWKLICRELIAWRGFANSEGTRGLKLERYSYLVPELKVSAQGRGYAREVFGGIGGVEVLGDLQPSLAEMVNRALRQDSAEPVRPGLWPVVLDPRLSGLFFHEAMGHLLEADYSMNNPRLAELTAPGTIIGPKGLSVMDDPTLPGAHGSYGMDDEGVIPAPLKLVEDGRIAARMHSRVTGALLRQPSTGHARALSFLYPVQVRMSNTFILPGQSTAEELISQVSDGYYLKGTGSGETGLENFSFTCAEAFAIRQGKICEAVRAPAMNGNVFETLMNISGIGNEQQLFTGFCGKNGQIPLPVSFGGPTLLVKDMLLGW